jgi:hypothetical protein
MVRSLFRMLYRRYNNNRDPQQHSSGFKGLKGDDMAAVLLLSIIREPIELQEYTYIIPCIELIAAIVLRWSKMDGGE